MTTRPAAILFDMDGTLTVPMLDFDAIKRELGIGSRPILETIRHMSPGDAAAANAILERHEREAAEGSTLNAGCVELLNALPALGIKSALITRNTRASTTIVLAKHALDFDVSITRDDAPPKPSPVPLHRAIDRLGVSRNTAWMVGDGHHDIEAAVAANLPGVWLSHRQSRPFAAEPWKTIVDLPELQRYLESLSG